MCARDKQKTNKLQVGSKQSYSNTMSWESETVAPRGPVSYDSSNHCQILFQCFGSLWPRVLPYCAVNVLLMVLLTKLHEHDIAYLGISGDGHRYAGVIVSFLVVSRINTAVARYNECRGYLGTMYRETREMLQTAYILTRRDGNMSRPDKEWRSELAYRSMMMLRTAVSVVEYGSTQLPAWEVPELSGYELEYLTPTTTWRRVAEIKHTELSDSMRVPLRAAYLVRETLANQKKQLSKPLAIAHELKLLGNVDNFMGGWYGMRKFLTTPVPFPLIQMTRTIVLVYIFTLPLIFLNDTPEKLIYEHCVVVFLLTYGFVGLELVSIELDDPFGDDENDFDCLAYAKFVFDDIHLLIHDTDGPEFFNMVLQRMNSSRRGVRSEGSKETTALLNGNSGAHIV